MFSDYFKVDRSLLKSKGIFDPVMNLDTRLFIDPLLLKSSKHDFIRNEAYREYQEYFSRIVSLLSLSLEEGESDTYYRNSACRLLPQREIDGTCLGYGTNSIAGRGVPQTLKKALIDTAIKIVKAGVRDPELFTLLPLFNEGIGPDMISDITTYAIRKSLIAFSAKQAEELGVPLVEKTINGESYHVEGLNRVVEAIIGQFQFMIENKGLNELLWKGDKKGRCPERVPQLLFHMIALSYCRANKIDVSPEVDTGTGLIDFKFSAGYSHKVIVEFKYSDNPKIISGLSKQLPQYMVSEEAEIGHYVILDVGKMGNNKLKSLEKVRNELNLRCHLHYIDANIKPSASKL